MLSSSVRAVNKSVMLRSSSSSSARMPQRNNCHFVASIPAIFSWSLSSSSVAAGRSISFSAPSASSALQIRNAPSNLMTMTTTMMMGQSHYRGSRFSTQAGTANANANANATDSTNATATTATEHPEIEVVHAENAPKAIGPFSQAIKAHNTLYVSGCLGLDPKTAEFPSDDVQEQARQAITNLKRILVAGDSSLARVVKVTVLLTDINDFAKVNAVYSEYFTGIKPARTTYAVVALPKNAKVEIEAIALVGKGANEQRAAEESSTASTNANTSNKQSATTESN